MSNENKELKVNGVNLLDERAVGLKCFFWNDLDEPGEYGFLWGVTSNDLFLCRESNFYWGSVAIVDGDEVVFTGDEQPVPDGVKVEIWDAAGQGAYETAIDNAEGFSWGEHSTIAKYRVIGRASDMPLMVGEANAASDYDDALLRHGANIHIEDRQDVIDDLTIKGTLQVAEAISNVDTLMESESDADCNSAWDDQIAGNHYKDLKIQPMEFSMRNGLNALQHTAVEYITRFRAKAGVEDLKKARHSVNMLIDYDGVRWGACGKCVWDLPIPPSKYAMVNKLDVYQGNAINHICGARDVKELKTAIQFIDLLIKYEEDCGDD